MGYKQKDSLAMAFLYYAKLGFHGERNRRYTYAIACSALCRTRFRLFLPPYFQRTRKNRDNLEWQDVSEVWEQGHNYVTLSGSFQGRVNESFAPKIYLKINPQVNWDFAITTCKVSQIQITIASFNVAEHVQLAWMQATGIALCKHF